MDQLARIIQVIGEDDALKSRFCAMAKLSHTQRINQISILAEHMNAERKDPELIAVFRLFTDEQVFEAAMLTLRQCGYLKA